MQHQTAQGGFAFGEWVSGWVSGTVSRIRSDGGGIMDGWWMMGGDRKLISKGLRRKRHARRKRHLIIMYQSLVIIHLRRTP